MSGIFGSAVLDVAIGLVFLYLLLSILCTAANEWIAALSKSRGVILEKSIRQLLASQPMEESGSPDGFLEGFYEHALVKGMTRGRRHPAYLSARVFSKAVMDLLTPQQTGKLAFADLEAGVNKLPGGEVKQALLALLKDAEEEVDGFRRAVEGWFEDKMDRASGTFKRRTQLWTVLVAIFITVTVNADTLRMVRRLWANPELRAAVVEEAKIRAQQPRPTVSVEYPDPDNPENPVVTELNQDGVFSERERELLGQVLGWQANAPDEPRNPWARWLQRLLGWFITVLAVSLGAPFWFDLLNKFIHIRSAGKSPDETAKRPEKKKLPPEDKTA